MVDAARSPFLVGVDDYFSIAARVKAMAALFQARAKVRKIIYLAIEYNADFARFVVIGLTAASEVDNAQPAHTEDHSGARVHSFIVGYAADERVHHRTQPIFGDRAVLTVYHTHS